MLDMNLINKLTNYDTAKERLFIKVSNIERNRERFENVPCLRQGELAITCNILAYDNGDFVSIVINNKMLDNFGISKEKLFIDALANSIKLMPPVIRPIKDVLAELMENEAPAPHMEFDEQLKSIDLKGKEGMYVLSNTKKINGAGVMFYPEVLEKISQSAKSDLIILPSSIHEVLILADDGRFDNAELEFMVKEINRNELKEKDVLSDTVYHYDGKAHLFERNADYKERVTSEMAYGKTAKKSIKEQLISAGLNSTKEQLKAAPKKNHSKDCL